MGDNLIIKPPPANLPTTVPDIRPKTDFEKLSEADQKSIKDLNSNSNILNPDATTAEGIEKAIITAGKTINEIRGKMDDLIFGKFEIAATEDTGSVNPMTGFKETLDKGIFFVMDKLLEVDMCNILDYALNQIPGGKKFDPNVAPKSDDPLARKKYEIQLRAYQVQVLIDDFYSLYGDNNTSKKKNALVGLIKKVRSILEEVLGIEPTQELSPEQQIEQEASGLSIQDSLKGNAQVQQVRELVGKDGLRDVELVAAFPELQLFSNFLEDVYSVFNKYSDVRNFPSQDVQKALKKIDDVRTIAISIQNLTSVTGAINLADRFLDGKISKFIKMISKIIDPKKIIPFLKTIIEFLEMVMFGQNF